MSRQGTSKVGGFPLIIFLLSPQKGYPPKGEPNQQKSVFMSVLAALRALDAARHLDQMQRRERHHCSCGLCLRAAQETARSSACGGACIRHTCSKEGNRSGFAILVLVPRLLPNSGAAVVMMILFLTAPVAVQVPIPDEELERLFNVYTFSDCPLYGLPEFQDMYPFSGIHLLL